MSPERDQAFVAANLARVARPFCTDKDRVSNRSKALESALASGCTFFAKTHSRKHRQMKQPFFTIVLCSAFGLLGLTGGALADSIRRYDCTIDGTDREAIGDRNGHIIVSLQYTCHIADGLLKDAGITAISVSEWDSEKGRYLASLDVHRALEGYAVGQLLDGDGASVMEDNRAAGIAAAGKTVFKFASGSLAALSGKTVKFTTKSVGSRRFEMEFADWPEASLPK